VGKIAKKAVCRIVFFYKISCSTSCNSLDAYQFGYGLFVDW